MKEDLPIMILLNMGLDTVRLENMEDELLSLVILNPIHSTSLLRDLMMATILNTKTQKQVKT